MFELKTLEANLSSPIDLEEIGRAILQILPGFFGGRTQQQIQQDEVNSIIANQQGYYDHFGKWLPNTTVAQILAPGWQNHENGSQLWQRMVQFHDNGERIIKPSNGGGITASFDLSTVLLIGAGVFMVYELSKRK